MLQNARKHIICTINIAHEVRSEMVNKQKVLTYTGCDSRTSSSSSSSPLSSVLLLLLLLLFCWAAPPRVIIHLLLIIKVSDSTPRSVRKSTTFLQNSFPLFFVFSPFVSFLFGSRLSMETVGRSFVARRKVPCCLPTCLPACLLACLPALVNNNNIISR
jgi:hypothetical protein